MIVGKTFLYAVLFTFGLAVGGLGYILAALAFARFGYFVVTDYNRVNRSPY